MNESNSPFSRPASCEDAEERIENLLERRLELEYFLSVKASDPWNSEKIPGVKEELFRVEKEIRFLKRWMKGRRREIERLLNMEEFCVNPRDILSVLAGAYHLLKRLVRRTGKLETREQAILDLVEATLKDKGFRVSQQRGG